MATRLPAPIRPMWPGIKQAYTVATRAVAPLSARLSSLRGGWLPSHSATTIETSIAGGGGRMWVAKPGQRLRRGVPGGRPARHPTFVTQSEERVGRVAVAELPHARVLGRHRAVVDQAGAMVEEFSAYWGTTHWREHPAFWHPFPGPPVEVKGALGVLAGRGDVSYYHFLIDILPRLSVLETPGVPAPERWYVPLQRDFQRETLELMEFLPDADVVDADLVTHVRAERLLVPGIPDAELRTPRWAVDFIRERLRPAGIARVPGRRIYVTRGRRRHNRTVRNEPDVVEMLAARGFTVVDPGTTPVKQQIRTFAEAEWIVGPHGAALANIAFASPGASVIELFAPDYVQGCYWKLADCVPGVGYQYLVGVGRPPRNDRMQGVMSDVTVDLPALAEMLDALG